MTSPLGLALQMAILGKIEENKMETTQVRAVSNPVVALGSRTGIKKHHPPYTLYRQIWLEGLDFDKLRRVADCLVFYLEVTGSAAYPVIVWERPEGFDVRWAGEPPAALADKHIRVAGTSFALQRNKGRLRVA